MTAFLAPGVIAAIVLFAQHVHGVTDVTRFPVLLRGDPLANMLLGILDYLPVAAVVPVAFVLLARTGQTPRSLGLGLGAMKDDVLPALGLVALSYLATLALGSVLAPLLEHNSAFVSKIPVGPVPHYYVIWGLAISATTAVAEEVLVNGYLLTRLEQLGWTPGRAFALSLTLRTSYHVYYGLAFVLTIPFGFWVTWSFQRNRRLNRAIAAHFLYDAILVTISVLT